MYRANPERYTYTQFSEKVLSFCPLQRPSINLKPNLKYSTSWKSLLPKGVCPGSNDFKVLATKSLKVMAL